MTYSEKTSCMGPKPKKSGSETSCMGPKLHNCLLLLFGKGYSSDCEGDGSSSGRAPNNEALLADSRPPQSATDNPDIAEADNATAGYDRSDD